MEEQVIGQSKKPRARGTDPEDVKSFSEAAVKKLCVAQEEVAWLLERGYPLQAVITLVGGHYQFTARQRLALQRATGSKTMCKLRKDKLLQDIYLSEGPLHIDGFNLIITLEVALSKGLLLSCSDGTVRDLAGLRGTYHLIDKTDIALGIIGEAIKEFGIPEMVFWLDSPISNSGRLKQKILEFANEWGIPVDVQLVPNADVVLEKMERVVTGDSIILDCCKSWFNLAPKIIEKYIPEVNLVKLDVFC